MKSKIFILFLLINACYCRVPPKDQRETEDAATLAIAENKPPKDDAPLATPVERSLIDSNDQSVPPSSQQPTLHGRRPISVILFRQQPTISLFSNRSPNPFVAPWHSQMAGPMDHSHHSFNNNGDIRNDPAIRLISLLLGDRRLRPIQPESDSETVNTSSAESSAESTEDNRREVNPFESIFPNIFPTLRFPLDRHPSLDDETEKEGTSASEANGSDDKAPANFENKEKKVINLGGRKFIKTTQTKKVKNDFGQFHSVISSYEPFDEKRHDENGNEKEGYKPTLENENDDKQTSNVDKKDVESSTPSDDKIPNDNSSSSPSSSSPSTLNEKEETPSTETPEIKPIVPAVDLATTITEQKEPGKMKVSDLSKEQDESKNEIPDKNAEIKEIKVDQMN